ncbi:NUDIX hydrolase [Levilactobacillus wangkuiensis]|uniref:NUDIX hydrolase n=1 Tax=Levilactobacillus wangkuiensis TaxID=2799566 RepID=UPI001941ECE1|nr:NUDIX hydrolase [Levilactobacillus wangkuiensis]
MLKKMLNRLIAHVIVPTNKGIVVLRRTQIERGETNVFPGWWDLPGGLTSDGEFPQAAAVRECAEEIGLRVTIQRIILETSNVDAAKATLFTRLIYLADEVDLGNGQNIRLDLAEHDRLQYLTSLDQLTENHRLIPYVVTAVSQVLKK